MESKQTFIERKIKQVITAADQWPVYVGSERSLAEKYGVSRMTVRQAMMQLANHGWLIRYAGRKGTWGTLPKQQLKFTIIKVSRVTNDMLKLDLTCADQTVSLSVTPAELKKMKEQR